MTDAGPELTAAREAVERAVPDATIHTREWREESHTLVICVAGTKNPQDAIEQVLAVLAGRNRIRAIECGQGSHEVRAVAVEDSE